MAMGSLDKTTVTLIPNQLIMTQGADMPIFHITDWNLGSKTLKKSGKSGLRMLIVMKRKITSEIMTTYFPSLLLTAITFATTFFKPFFFEAALSVNLTTMLVMTTIFISKMEGLPPTSDIKMIDVWLVLCQMVPFAEVVLLTAMEYHRKDQDDKDVEITEILPKVTAATQTRLSIRSILPESTFDTQNTNIKHQTSTTQTNDNEEMGISMESQWSPRICQKRWFPSLKTIGLFDFIQIIFDIISIYITITILIFSEQKVMPCLILASFFVYFVVAAIFYFC